MIAMHTRQASTPTMTPRSLASRPRVAAAGFTLIEMMVAITIGLGILAGLVGVLASNASNVRTNERTSELMTNGRYALSSMKAVLREAGFRGYTFEQPGTPSPWTVPTTGATNFCAGADAGATYDAFITNVRQAVWGSNDSNPFSANCIPAARYLGGNDVLVVRHLSANPTADADLQSGTIYFRSAYERGQVFRSAATPVVPPDYSGSNPVGNFAVQTYVYYISPVTEPANPENPPVPALRRLSLQPDGLMRDEIVASGIEAMQVQYGRRVDLDASQTQTETRYVDTLSGAAEWNRVNSVQLWLLARNAAVEPGYQNTNTYQMGTQSITVADGFRRQLFSAVIQLRN